MNLLLNPGAEADLADWTPAGQVAAVTTPVHAGAKAFRLRSRFFISGPPTAASMLQACTLVVGQDYPMRGWLNGASAEVPGASTNQLEILADAGDGVFERLGSLITPFAGGYQSVEFGEFTAVGPDGRILIVSKPVVIGEIGNFNADWFIDDLELSFPDQEELMARSKMEQFLQNLKGKIEGIDPQIGKVFLAERRWSSDQDLVDAGAVLQLNTAGLFEDPTDLGTNATRFWILEPWIEIRALTNNSTQYDGQVRIIGFWGWREDEREADKLREAVTELLDMLTLKQTELGDLAAGMSTGYMGYLENMPRMLGPVRGAELQSGAQGHVAQILTGYHEEIDR